MVNIFFVSALLAVTGAHVLPSNISVASNKPSHTLTSPLGFYVLPSHIPIIANQPSYTFTGLLAAAGRMEDNVFTRMHTERLLPAHFNASEAQEFATQLALAYSYWLQNPCPGPDKANCEAGEDGRIFLTLPLPKDAVSSPFDLDAKAINNSTSPLYPGFDHKDRRIIVESHRQISAQFDRADPKRDLLVVQHLRNAAMAAYDAGYTLASFRNASILPNDGQYGLSRRFRAVEDHLSFVRHRLQELLNESFGAAPWDVETTKQLAYAMRVFNRHLIGPLVRAFDVKVFLMIDQHRALRTNFELIYEDHIPALHKAFKARLARVDEDYKLESKAADLVFGSGSHWFKICRGTKSDGCTL